MGFLTNLFDDNAKDIKKYSRRVGQINSFEPEIAKLSNEELAAKTVEFKERLAGGITLDELLPEAFAVCREASKRVLGMRHFDVQLIGGMVLHDGRIAEMKTGEGKTLVATLAVYLNALAGKGVHVITVNDYLAERDSQWMGRLYRFLGLSVGLVVHNMEGFDKKESYQADITYGTNNEFGFDYLRDNMAVHPSQIVQRPLHYAIVDEVDSILIDEARTPLIISGPSEKPTSLYYDIAKVIPRLKQEDDYTVDEKARAVMLTESGVSRLESMLGVENLYDNANSELNHHVMQGLKARVLFKRDRDYVVKEGQVIIVDEFTGRLMFGRRYSDGLHQAIEAKEGVKIERESQTLATITFQNYFRMYEKLAGMTGTAATEEEEFRKIYHFDVVTVPTNLPMVREDFPDSIYRSEDGKFNAVVDAIAERHATGQPVLVGTISIEKSERLSKMLHKKGVTHNVLNAKFHEKEAEIVAQAGRKGSVTIATNMAGRGTDIMLGGNPEFMAREEMERCAEREEKEYTNEEVQALIAKYRSLTAQEHEEVKALGGLHIIGTERHESRRIDNQLRGRSGRQGDPGSSRFYISMEDDLMRIFGAEHVKNLMDKLGVDDSMPIDSSLVSKSIESAQKRVESRNFDIRKNVLDYDDVMNQQREIIYKQRLEVLREINLREQVMGMLDEVIERTIAHFSSASHYTEEWDVSALLIEIDNFLPNHGLTEQDITALSKDEVIEMLKGRAVALYEAREERIGEEQFRNIERVVILRVVDEKWMDHIDAMDIMRQGIHLRAYAQRDPLVEYKHEAYEMFQEMIADIQLNIVRLMMRVEIAERPQARREMHENRDGDGETAVKKPIRKDGKTVGRNDPCPCGSGLKYKKCCGKNTAE